MKRWRQSIRVSPVLVVMLLVTTNPTRDSFIEYLFGVSAADAARLMTDPHIRGSVEQSVALKDLGLCTFFVVQMDSIEDLVWLGILEQFIPWPQGWPTAVP